MDVANTLAYYDTATITAVKNFIVQAPGGRRREIGEMPEAESFPALIEIAAKLERIQNIFFICHLQSAKKLSRFHLGNTSLSA
jgi:hypothetical protein